MPDINDYFLTDAEANASGYRDRLKNIPFLVPNDDSTGNIAVVNFLWPMFEEPSEFTGQLSAVKNKAVDRYMLHFFPEYYKNYRVHRRALGNESELDPIYEQAYRRIRQTLKSNVSAIYYRPHNPVDREDKDIVSARLSFPLQFELTKNEVAILNDRIAQWEATATSPGPGTANNKAYLAAEGLSSADQMDDLGTQYVSLDYPSVLVILLGWLELVPPMDEALTIFNEDQKITASGRNTTLQVGSLMQDNNFFNDGLGQFQEQINGFEGSLPIPLDFGAVQSSTTKILNIVVTEIVKDLGNSWQAKSMTFDTTGLEFSDADSIFLEFGSREIDDKTYPTFSRISYIVNELSPLRETLKTGYMTNSRWNRVWRDPFTIDTLKMYNTLVDAMRIMDSFGGNNFSFTEFLQGGDFGLGDQFDFSQLPQPADTKNLFLKEAAKLGIIDLSDVKNLEKGIAQQLGVAQLREYRRKVRENPELYQKVRAESKKKVLKTGLDVTKHIGNVLNGNMPIPGMKKDSKLAVLLQQIGIQELAKEALICLTFGLAPAFARLNNAVASAIQSVGQELYVEPPPPKPGATMPPIDIKNFKPKTIDGDMWKQILKIMLDTLMEGVLEIIKSLADLLKIACEIKQGRAQDFGENDLGSLVNNGLDPSLALPRISNQSAIDRIAQDNGLTLAEMMQYFTDLSAILSSIEICYLFMNRDEIPGATVEKILDFNLSYNNLKIRQNLNTYSSLLGFFARLSEIVDMSDFCNEVATAVYQENYDNICLVAELAPPVIDETLQRIAEEGIQIDNPGSRINLDCPNKAGYIENATVDTDIPGLLNTVTEVVELDFVNALAAAQQALKVPDIELNPLMGDTLDATGAAPDLGEMSEVGQQILGGISSAFTEIESLVGEMGSHCDLTEILGVEADAVGDVVEVLVDVLGKLFDSGEFAGALTDIENQIEGLTAAGEAGAPVSPTFTFPQQFTDKFLDYLTTVPEWNSRKTTDAFGAPAMLSAGQFSLSAAGLSDPYSYRTLNLQFKFPQRNPAAWVPDPSGATYNSGLPKYVMEQPEPDDIDALTIKYPGRTQAITHDEYVQVALKSSLLPTGSTAINFNITNPPASSVDSGRSANPYVARFSDAIDSQIAFRFSNWDTDSTRLKITRQSDTLLFPAAFTGLTEHTFNYIKKNGIFNLDKLNSLTFFHDNSNCLPDDVADLLDIDGLLKELQDEMVDALCHDSPSGLGAMEGKIRDVIRYGVFLLFIQIYIAQFIIKNIFVFAAFNIDDLLNSDLTKQFMAVSIRDQALRTLGKQPIVQDRMLDYFTKKLARSNVVAAGGLLDDSGTVVFEAQTILLPGDFPALVEYVVGQRITRSRKAVANAVIRASDQLSPKNFNRAFIEDILGFEARNFGSFARGTGLGGAGHADDNVGKRIRLRVNETVGGGIKAFPALSGPTASRTGIANAAYNYHQMRNEELDDPEGGSWMAYGKLVLERRVVWSNVTNTETFGALDVPEILRATTGEDYGLELNFFRQLLFNHGIAAGDGDVRGEIMGVSEQDAAPLRFDDLAIKYDIVYYTPAVRPDPYGNLPSGSPTLGRNASTVQPHLWAGSSPGAEQHARFKLDTLDLRLPLSNHVTLSEVETIYGLMDIDGVAQYGSVERPILHSLLSAYNKTATNSELLGIVADPVYNDFFGKAFNRDLIMLIPVMHNYYLTTSFFPQFDKLLQAPKERCIQIFVDTTRGEDEFLEPESLRPQAAEAARRDPNMEQLQQSVMDFILKMLIETPIQILRGVSEMLDPHVAVWKIVRDVTGAVFQQMAHGIDTSGTLDPLKTVPIPPEDPNYSEEPGAENTMPGLAPDITGEGVLRILFCLLAVAMKATQQGFVLGQPSGDTAAIQPLPPSAPDSDNFLGKGDLGVPGAILIGNPPRPERWPDPPTVPGHLLYQEGQLDPRDPRNNVPEELRDNFFPRITVEGVDFTGTFLGLLCMPPGPFGIVYLLLMLLKGKIEEDLEDAFNNEDGLQNVGDENASDC